ncbi:MAG: DUF881 domain-containing protein [Marmoricola sp.]
MAPETTGGATTQERQAAGAGPMADSPATMGLLPYLTQHALDEDYAVTAARTRAAGSDRPGRRRPVWTVLAVAAFVLLLVTAAGQTSKDAVSAEGERRDLVAQVRDRQDALAAQQARVEALQQRVQQLRTRLTRSGRLSTGTRTRLSDLSVLAGTVAVVGPGVRVVVDDAPNAQSDRNRVLDSDLQQLVNGLWAAGAEAIAINGERLTNLTPIREAGSAITVNLVSLDRPYRVEAIGDPSALPGRFAQTAGGAAWLDLHQQVGLRFDLSTQSRLRLPAAALPDLRHASTRVTVLPGAKRQQDGTSAKRSKGERSR